MTFLHPEWLWGLLTSLFVAYLHMRRRTLIITPSVQIWRSIQHGAQNRSRLQFPRPGSELLLQLACIAAVFTALAEPTWSGDARSSHRVFIIDLQRGADPGANARLDEALQHVRSALAARPPVDSDRVSIIAASADASPLAARWSRADRLEAVLSGLRPEEAAPDWRSVARQARAVLNSGERTQVVVLSDQALDDAILELESANVELQVRSSQKIPPATARISDLTATPVGATPFRKWRVRGVLDGAASTSVAVSFQPEGAASFLDWTTLEAEPGGRFSAEVALPGAGILSVRTLDAPTSRSFLTLRDNPRRVRVAMVGAEDEAVVRALRAVEQVEMTTLTALPARPADFDLVVANNVVLPRHPGINTVWIGAARLQTEAEPRRVDQPDVTMWDDDHVLSAGLAWRLVKIASGLSFAGRAGDRVLLGSGATPLIIVRNGPAGIDVRLAFETARSNWPELSGFPEFIARIVTKLNIPSSQTCVAGRSCAVERRLIGPATKLFDPDGREVVLPQVRLLKATSDDPWFPADMESAFLPLRSGLYRLVAADGAYPIAVNPGPAPAWMAAQPVESASLDAPWRWFAAAAVLLLLVELANARYGQKRIVTADLFHRTGFKAKQRRSMIAIRALSLAAVALALAQALAPAFLPGSSRIFIGDTEPGGGSVVAGPDPVLMQDVEGGRHHRPEDSIRAADLEEAVGLATAMVSSPRGSIIVSEQAPQSRGEVAASLRRFANPAVRLMTVPEQITKPVLEIRHLAAPAKVRAGDRFVLTTILASRESQEAAIKILRNGVLLSEQRLKLESGDHRIETVIPEVREGRAFYSVEAQTGSLTQGDGVFVTASPAPRIAIVTPDAAREEAARVAEALRIQSIESRIIPARNAPWSLKDWLVYDGVILVNLPAVDLDTRQQEMIETTVSRYGRGLLILGGENAFGPGGYFGTPLERMSPLSARIPTEAPQAAMVFVLDRSGSMTQSVGDGTRLDIAKSATVSAIELLHEESDISIVTFDSEAQAILPLQKKNMDAVRRALAPLTPGGGTSIYPGLVEAERQLIGNESRIKHVVVMTDGLTQPGDFQGVIGRLRAMGATVSGLAIGSSADPATVQDIARMGGGSFHGTADFQALPGILAREAMSLSGEGVKERAAQPQWNDRTAAFLDGVQASPAPVAGYVLTTAKPEAKLHLSISEADGTATPLLASWAYGQGQVAALATHGAGPWTADWQTREDFPLFIAQTVRASTRGAHGTGLQLSLVRNRDDIRVELEATGADGKPLTAAEIPATINFELPNGSAASQSTLALKMIAPGRFAAAFIADGPGNVLASVELESQRAEAALHIEAPALLSPRSRQPELLKVMALATGGAVMSRQQAQEMAGEREISFSPQWRFWLLLALVLFLFDLTLRHAPGLLRLRR